VSAVGSSPACNTGTKLLADAGRTETHIDWCAGRSIASPNQIVEALSPVFGATASLALRSRGRGRLGFTQSSNLKVASNLIGWLQWGGDSQCGWIHLIITGRGCGLVLDWDLAQQKLGGLPAWQYRRVDIAADAFANESSNAQVLAAHSRGEFNSGGRPPALKQIGVRSPVDSSTIYVGSRQRDKLLRSYDKVLQLASLASDASVVTEGMPPVWYRVELELKAKFSALPADVIVSRDRYFAEAYSYTAWLLSKLRQRSASELSQLEVP